MDIPELRLMVAQHLSGNDLKAGPSQKVCSDDLVLKLIEQNPRFQRLSINTISCLQPPQVSVLSNLSALDINMELSVHVVIDILSALLSLNDLTLYLPFSPHSRLPPNTGDRAQMQPPSSSLSSPSSSLSSPSSSLSSPSSSL
ncbi:hypothetical protein BGZ73_006965 [Actinomortierella ambigua]|nr:hypothetical protein BGZ73_006965 [Actinomortierella ambigua]